MRSSLKCDLAIVNPGGRAVIYQSLSNELTAIEPPVWAGLMATYVRNHGLSVTIIDGNAEELSPDETADRVIQTDPLLVAVVAYGHQPSASTQVMVGASAVCRAIKEKAPYLKIILAGGHVAALPERTLREEAVDFVAGGEGLRTLVDLCRTLKSAAPDYSKVSDLWYHDGHGIGRGPSAFLVQDLDAEMPGIAWDLLPMRRYRAHNWHCFGGLDRQPYAALYTSLGCPYRCDFCCINAPFVSGAQAMGLKTGARSYRMWSPETVIRQIDTLVNDYSVRNIKIADEIFVFDKDHVRGIADAIIARGYDLNIWAYARTDTVDPRMLDKLKAAGINWLALGIEAADERVLADVSKRVRRSKVIKTVSEIRSAGINVIANFIFGLPEDDLNTMTESLDLALELNCEFANFYCAMAYPGSELYDRAREEGWPLPEKWSGYSQYARDALPLPTRHLSGEEVLQFRDKAFQAYFGNEAYLSMIAEKFSPETAEHIRAMASHKLARDIR